MKNPASKFAPQMRVRYTAKFLKCTGQYTGRAGREVFTILAVKGDFVTVDQLTDTSGFTATELEADPSLKYLRINAYNLIQVGKPDYTGL